MGACDSSAHTPGPPLPSAKFRRHASYQFHHTAPPPPPPPPRQLLLQSFFEIASLRTKVVRILARMGTTSYQTRLSFSSFLFCISFYFPPLSYQSYFPRFLTSFPFFLLLTLFLCHLHWMIPSFLPSFIDYALWPFQSRIHFWNHESFRHLIRLLGVHLGLTQGLY